MRIFGLQKALITAETIQQYQEQLSTLTKPVLFGRAIVREAKPTVASLLISGG